MRNSLSLRGQTRSQNIAAALLLLLSAIASSQSWADASVWEVKSGSSTVYLGGTVHLLRPGDYPLPREYDQAYSASSEIFFETDLGAMNDISVQAQMLQQLTYQDGRNLKTVLNEKAYSALESYTQKVGMPLMMLEQMKPGMVVSMLQVLEFQRIGFTPQGVDAHFDARARGDGKALGQLESVAEQIGFLASMGEGNESEFILLSLSDLAETASMMDGMIAAWRSGNNDALSELFVDDMRTQAPAVYDALLKQRNLNWIPQIENMLRDSDTEFVLVGAAHLVGPDGLLQLLERRGYQVNQL